MSDDKDKKDQGTGDGTRSDSKTGDDSKTPTTMGFGELMGHVDSRIETAVRNVLGKSGDSKTATDTKQESPESVAQQVRNELAKLNSEEAATKKEADRDVTIAELQAQVTKLSETAPTQTVSKLTQVMWGGRKKT